MIARHVTLDRDKVQVTMDRGDNVSMLEIDVEVPHPAGVLAAVDGKHPGDVAARSSYDASRSVQASYP